MFKRSFLIEPMIFPVLITAILFMAGQAEAQTKISGEMTMAYTSMDSLVVGDTDGHKMVIGESEGTNKSTGDEAFMDGARTVNYSYIDMVMGNGPHEGYATFNNGDDMTVVKWKGTVVTAMTPEGTPNITFSGTFDYTGGSGTFENIKGGGTYEGHFTSTTEYVVDWKGSYTLK